MTPKELIEENIVIIKNNYDLLRRGVWLLCFKGRVKTTKN